MIWPTLAMDAPSLARKDSTALSVNEVDTCCGHVMERTMGEIEVAGCSSLRQP